MARTRAYALLLVAIIAFSDVASVMVSATGNGGGRGGGGGQPGKSRAPGQSALDRPASKQWRVLISS